jgi:hypothetical protein
VPTVIDSLVVQLGLDPTNFNQEQQRAVESLRKFQDTAEGSARRVVRSTSEGAAGFFRAVESPISGLRRQFETWAAATEKPRRSLADVGEQATRTGEDVERGAMKGAAALRVLGLAGLGAFAAYETLRKGTEALNATASRVFGAGVGATFAGLPIREFTAISQALFAHGNVPLAQSEDWLQNFGTTQALARVGDQGAYSRLTAMQTAFARAGLSGINVYQTGPEQLLEQIAAQLGAMTPAQRQQTEQQLTAAGFAPVMIQALAAAGGNLPGYIAAERGRAVTGAQSDVATRYIQAENNLANSWNAFSRAVETKWMPVLTELFNFLARVLGQPSKRESDEQQWQMNMPAPAGQHWAVETDPQTGKQYHVLAPGAPAAGQSAQPDPRSVWQRTMPSWLGGKPAPAPLPSAPPGPQSSIGTDAIVDYITRHEGGSPRGVINNPGNIKYAGLPGQIDSGVRAADGGTFASYATPEAGRQALADLVRRGMSGQSKAYGAHPTVDAFLREYSGGGYGASSALLSSIQAANASPSSTTNSSSINLNGDIVVNAPYREGSAIAGAVEDQIRRVQLSTSANSGQM